MLFYEKNRGLYYEYTIHQQAIPPGVASEFSWAYGAWTECPVTCGKGEGRGGGGGLVPGQKCR